MRPVVLVALLSACATAPISPAAIAHNQKAAKQLDEDRLDDAEAELRLALELSPRFAEAHANLGLLLARRGDPAAGLVELDRAVELDRELAVAHVGRGAVLASTGALPEAIAAYEDALALQPELVEARRNLVQLLIGTDRLRDARAHALRLVQLEPGRAESVAMAAYCDLLLGRPRAARERIAAATAVPQPAPALALVSALVSAAEGRSDEALVALAGLEADPVHGAAARARRAALLLDLGRPEDARAALRAMAARGDPAAVVEPLRARLP